MYGTAQKWPKSCNWKRFANHSQLSRLVSWKACQSQRTKLWFRWTWHHCFLLATTVKTTHLDRNPDKTGIPMKKCVELLVFCGKNTRHLWRNSGMNKWKGLQLDARYQVWWRKQFFIYFPYTFPSAFWDASLMIGSQSFHGTRWEYWKSNSTTSS